MCYHHEEEWRKDYQTPPRQPPPTTAAAAAVARSADLVLNLRRRLADIESRLALARAREAALSRQINETKRFVSVMEILESYLKRRFVEQQEIISRLLASVSQL
ncbi:protein SKIP34 [Silene latifolia]|uniref:protein SKIP34 n=1 Tax=Silene latifolia TaxID=37657 RepID=UPI003D773D24